MLCFHIIFSDYNTNDQEKNNDEMCHYNKHFGDWNGLGG